MVAVTMSRTNPSPPAFPPPPFPPPRPWYAAAVTAPPRPRSPAHLITAPKLLPRAPTVATRPSLRATRRRRPRRRRRRPWARWATPCPSLPPAGLPARFPAVPGRLLAAPVRAAAVDEDDPVVSFFSPLTCSFEEFFSAQPSRHSSAAAHGLLVAQPGAAHAQPRPRPIYGPRCFLFVELFLFLLDRFFEPPYLLNRKSVFGDSNF